MVSPIIAKGNSGPVYYMNLDANVGVNSPNKPDDVQLVQFGYLAMAAAVDTPPSDKAIYAAVVPGAAYSGGSTDPLTLAIKNHQMRRGGTQDGHVSVISSTTLVYADATGSHTFMLTALMTHIRDLTKGFYPRIDRHAKCPAVLKSRVLSMAGE